MDKACPPSPLAPLLTTIAEHSDTQQAYDFLGIYLFIYSLLYLVPSRNVPKGMATAKEPPPLHIQTLHPC